MNGKLQFVFGFVAAALVLGGIGAAAYIAGTGVTVTVPKDKRMVYAFLSEKDYADAQTAICYNRNYEALKQMNVTKAANCAAFATEEINANFVHYIKSQIQARDYDDYLKRYVPPATSIEG